MLINNRQANLTKALFSAIALSVVIFLISVSSLLAMEEFEAEDLRFSISSAGSSESKNENSEYETLKESVNLLYQTNMCLNEFRISDQTNDTLLHRAARNGFDDLTLSLIKYVQINNLPEIDLQNVDGDTALHLASRYGSREAISALLEAQANINMLNYFECTPLDVVNNEDAYLTWVLSFNGAKTKTALDTERRNGKNEVAWCGYEITEPDENQLLEGEQITEDFIKRFLANVKKGKNSLSDVLANGDTIITWFVQEKDIAGLEKLIDQIQTEFGPDELPAVLNETNMFGMNALHIAATKNIFDIVSFLIKHGASAQIETRGGRLAIELTTDDQIKELLAPLCTIRPKVVTIPKHYFVAGFGAALAAFISYLVYRRFSLA